MLDLLIEENSNLISELSNTLVKSNNFKIIILQSEFYVFETGFTQKLVNDIPVEIAEIDIQNFQRILTGQDIDIETKNNNLVLVVYELNLYEELEDLFQDLESKYQSLNANINQSIIIYLNSNNCSLIEEKYPSFHSQIIQIKLSYSRKFLTGYLSDLSENIFDILIDTGSGRFLNNIQTILLQKINLKDSSEISQAYERLISENISANSIHGKIEFIVGLLCSSSHETTVEYFGKSITKLQESTNNSLYLGIVLFYLGRRYRNQAESLNKDYIFFYKEAKNYFSQSIKIFKNLEREDLVIKFVNALGDALQRLEEWNELKLLCHDTISNFSKYSNDKLRLSRLFGFASIAEVNHEVASLELAKEFANKALLLLQGFTEEIYANRNYEDLTSYEKELLFWEHGYHKPLYYYTLALIEISNLKYEEAILSLKQAQDCAEISFEIRQYLLILEKFQEIYFNLKQYDAAYIYKLEILSIKQQYGLCGFIGSGQLSSEKYHRNPALIDYKEVEKKEPIATEIRACDRKHLVEDFAHTLIDSQSNFFILYGPSGTGKSSLIKAGLIPYLSHQKDDSLNTLSILFQSNFLNWINGVGNSIVAAIKHTLADNWKYQDYYIADILEKLKELSRNRPVVFYFDNFEDFYLTTNNIHDRKALYNFLIDCIKIDNLTIVISIQDNYLHNLLELSRNYPEKILNIDILSHNHLLYLGNLSKEQAYKLISDLTKFSVKPFKSELIIQIVNDLAYGNGSINPIELQILCQTLEEHKVYALEAYTGLGYKPGLLRLYLDQVIIDCGASNYDTTRSLLFRMIDKKNERIVKTISELKILTKASKEELLTILSILIKAGVILEIVKDSQIYYQLTNDYVGELLKAQLGFDYEHESREYKEAFDIASAESDYAAIQQLIEKSKSDYLSVKFIEALLLAVKAAQNYQQLPSEFQQKDDSIRYVLCKYLYYSDANELNRFMRHTGKVSSVEFGKSGNIVISASFDRTFSLWHIDGGHLKTLDKHTDWVNHAVISPNNRFVASCSKDLSIRVWELINTSEKEYELKPYGQCTGHEGGVNSICFNSSSEILVSASGDGTISTWNLRGNRNRTYIGHRGPVNCVKYSEDNRYLVSCGSDHLVHIWDVNRENPIRTMRGHSDFVNSIDISSDNKWILSGSSDCTIRLWDFNTGQQLKLYNHHTQWVSCVLFASDNQSFYSASGDSTICITRILSKKTIKTIHAHVNEIRHIAKNNEHEILASCSNDTSVKLWDIRTPLEAHSEAIRDLQFSNNSKIVATSGDDGFIKLWSENGKYTGELDYHDSPVLSISFSHNSLNIASVSTSGCLLYSSVLGDILFSYYEKDVNFTSVLISPDSTLIAVGDTLGSIRIFNEYGDLLYKYQAHDDWVNDLLFTDDSNRLISAGSDYLVKVWTKVGLWSINEEWIHPNIKSEILRGHFNIVNSLSLNSDCSYLISASSDCRYIKWCMTSYGKVENRAIHSNAINMVAITPDDKFIITASSDQTLKVYQFSGKYVVDFHGHTDWVSGVKVSKDLTRIAISSGDGLLTITSLVLDDLLNEGIKRTQGFRMNDKLYEIDDVI